MCFLVFPKVIECLTTVKKVNKTDAATLMNTFKVCVGGGWEQLGVVVVVLGSQPKGCGVKSGQSLAVVTIPSCK